MNLKYSRQHFRFRIQILDSTIDDSNILLHLLQPDNIIFTCIERFLRMEISLQMDTCHFINMFCLYMFLRKNFNRSRLCFVLTSPTIPLIHYYMKISQLNNCYCCSLIVTVLCSPRKQSSGKAESGQYCFFLYIFRTIPQ